ncbi:sigma-54 dependent transcriptional regulator [Flavobacterium branchiarum]|uniref:Sigma-54 interaction domain-containing protein n=1 Tax=Flavobacterium branchiarum TaxID=1114870 RepID=A0ABV5FMS2_9FLAO|nr:sigma-54 dependent transcriptional regulator [Flavobacterium branchiarum]MDN3674370.1 sigma-54 dependent transcriptional regulator [Flavobacterium branchiarum]
MEKLTDQTAIMLNRLQEREREQILILSICKSLSEVLTKSDFQILVNGLLKEHFLFEDFIFASANKEALDYTIFFQFSDQKESESKNYAVEDGFFDACLNSADNVIFDLKTIKEEKNKLPDYLQSVSHKNFNNGIGIGLIDTKGNRNVFFLFFKNASIFSRESNRILRGIATQLYITVQNIQLIAKYENNLAELKLLKNNFEERKVRTINTATENFHGIVGKSVAIQNVYELISQVALSNSTVLITGETGTGKELIASAIHQLSSVSNEKMIKVNCASIPENLIESELFGHEKGAFTGALNLRIGKFEQAENSTIFLDEIGELPLELQGKLLRVLQEKEIERVGGNKSLKLNTRIIAATNKSLVKEVAEGRFRSDLFYRLNVFPIDLPALRERPEDIEILSNFFLEKHSNIIGKKIKGFSKKVLKKMLANPWLGNVRELENMIERSILFTTEDVINEMIFPKNFIRDFHNLENDFNTKTLQEVEKEHILEVVRKCGGRISGPQGAAVLLDLPATTLISKMQKLGIRKKYF